MLDFFTSKEFLTSPVFTKILIGIAIFIVIPKIQKKLRKIGIFLPSPFYLIKKFVFKWWTLYFRS